MKSTAFWIHHLLRFDPFDAEHLDLSIPLHPGAKLRAVGHWFYQWLINGNEPKVWKETDRSGHTIWHGYDPVSNVSVTFDHESEIRSWLEKRYNEPAKRDIPAVLR